MLSHERNTPTIPTPSTTHAYIITFYMRQHRTEELSSSKNEWSNGCHDCIELISVFRIAPSPPDTPIHTHTRLTVIALPILYLVGSIAGRLLCMCVCVRANPAMLVSFAARRRPCLLLTFIYNLKSRKKWKQKIVTGVFDDRAIA